MSIPLILQPITILLIAAALTPLINVLGEKIKFDKLKDLFAILAFASAFYALILLYFKIEGYGAQFFILDDYLPIKGGVEIYADSLSLFLAFIFCGIGFLASIYSVKYMEVDTGLDRYYTLLLILVAGMIGVAFSGDFFNLYVFWEMMCIASYTLVSFRKYRWEPVEAGFKYLVMSTLGSLIALYGISLLYGLTGTVNFKGMKEALASTTGSQIPLYIILAAIIVGFGVTASIVPFHSWLPDAHPAAPSSISAMLSGVVIKTGVYAMARSLFTLFNPVNFDYGLALMIFGVLTITVANFMALMQRDIKRLLAYSSVVNIGYIIAGIGIGGYILFKYYSLYPSASLSAAAFAIMGALFHLFNHAVGKGMLFLCSGCFTHEAATRDISALEGIGRKMPLTGGSFSIGLLTLAGVPPFSGFWSKLFIILAAFSFPQNGFMNMIGVIIVLNSVFAAAYYLWLLQRVMIKTPKVKASEASIFMVAPIIILAVICIIIGLMPNLIINLAEKAAKAMLGGW
jgi:proton-translocating NADH-quinone oxidoreductase chain N